MPENETTREKIRKLEQANPIEVKPTININIKTGDKDIRKTSTEVLKEVKKESLFGKVIKFIDKIYP